MAYKRSAITVSTVAVVMLLQCHRPCDWSSYPGRYIEVGGTEISLRTDPSDKQEQFAKRDPLGFLKSCRAQYANRVKDYRCRFIKRELINGAMSAEQEIDVAYREHPFSVRMNWVKNAGRAQEVSYVEDRWVENGKQLALIKPSGFLGLLAPSGVKRDIRGKAVKAASRKTIDQYGFRNTLDLIIKFCDIAQGKPGYSLDYLGIADLNGRETYVLERRLPFTVEDKPYPDRLLLIYIDREWLLPVGCYAYADDKGSELLGQYVSKNVTLNVGLSDADF